MNLFNHLVFLTFEIINREGVLVVRLHPSTHVLDILQVSIAAFSTGSLALFEFIFHLVNVLLSQFTFVENTLDSDFRTIEFTVETTDVSFGINTHREGRVLFTDHEAVATGVFTDVGNDTL